MIRGNKHIKKYIGKFKTSCFVRTLYDFLSEYWLLCYFTALIAYLELLYRLWIFNNINADYYSLLFALSGGAALYITNLFPKSGRVVTNAVTFTLCLVYGVQIIYFCISGHRFRYSLSAVRRRHAILGHCRGNNFKILLRLSCCLSRYYYCHTWKIACLLGENLLKWAMSCCLAWSAFLSRSYA